jgi:DNA-binding transcriptional LysR family regulator
LRGRLRLWASQTIAGYWLPPRLAAFHSAYPGINLEVAIGNTGQVAKAVAEGEAELGLVEGEVDNPVLSRTMIDQDQLSLFVGRSHPWSRSEPKQPVDPRQTPWVLREAGSGTRAALEAALAAQGLSVADLNVAMVLPSNEAVRAAVEYGAGAGVLSRSVIAPALARRAIVELPFDLPPRAFHLLRHKQRYRSKAGAAFVALASNGAFEPVNRST